MNSQILPLKTPYFHCKRHIKVVPIPEELKGIMNDTSEVTIVLICVLIHLKSMDSCNRNTFTSRMRKLDFKI